MNSLNDFERRDFLKRINKEPVKTSRYLWHIRYNDYSSDFQIAAKGLLCSENYAVFAHNNVAEFYTTFPYFLDSWDLFKTIEIKYSTQFSLYSFWRIDTRLTNFDWFVDPNLGVETKCMEISEDSFVCTLNSIPNYALKLFKYDRERYINRRPIVTFGDGVASVKAIRSDFDTLRPDVKINNYITQIKNNPKWAY